MLTRNVAQSPLPAVFTLVVAALGACTDDPQYIDSSEVLEVGFEGTEITTAQARVILPIRLEREPEQIRRNELRRSLGGIQVPFVRIDDLDVSIEWLVRNLGDTDGTARLHVNGGNEQFYYVPQSFVIDPEEDETPPPLVGDIPRSVPAGATITGVFREDQLREAAVDLELITRAGSNPFAAVFLHHDDLTEITDMSGATVPELAFGHMVQYDIIFEANRHMVMEFVIRVRDQRALLHDMLLDAPRGELTTFAPAEFVPPAPPAP